MNCTRAWSVLFTSKKPASVFCKTRFLFPLKLVSLFRGFGFAWGDPVYGCHFGSSFGWCVDRCSTSFSVSHHRPLGNLLLLGLHPRCPLLAGDPAGFPSSFLCLGFPFGSPCRWGFHALAFKKPQIFKMWFPVGFHVFHLVVLHRCARNMFISPTTNLATR